MSGGREFQRIDAAIGNDMLWLWLLKKSCRPVDKNTYDDGHYINNSSKRSKMLMKRVHETGVKCFSQNTRSCFCLVYTLLDVCLFFVSQFYVFFEIERHCNFPVCEP